MSGKKGIIIETPQDLMMWYGNKHKNYICSQCGYRPQNDYELIHPCPVCGGYWMEYTQYDENILFFFPPKNEIKWRIF